MKRFRSAFLALVLAASGLVVSIAADSAVADTNEGATVALQGQQRRITGGGLHTCAILDSGRVQCWGGNDYGQLGNNTLATKTAPTDVTGITTAVSLSAGSSHTCALLIGGSVRCWGLNGSGQVGENPTIQFVVDEPFVVPNLTNAVALASGGFHNCAIVADGTVKCWGVNANGELGNTTAPGYAFDPVPVVGITTANPAVALTAGEFHTCAVLNDGTARCWGHNGLGQLGNDSLVSSSAPVVVQLPAGRTVKAIAAGSQHTCVVLDDAKVRCWGLNFYGQLGNDDHGETGGLPKVSKVPIEPNPVQTAVAISAGAYHTCILRSDGKVRCWGANQRGQLGWDDPLQERLNDEDVPRELTTVAGVTALTTGGFHTCALIGTVMTCWGYNFYGQLGSYKPSNPNPVLVTALNAATALSVGDGHACVVQTAAGDYLGCWGSNSNGQLGSNSGANSTIVVRVPGIGETATFSAGNRFTCRIQEGAQQPTCFGANGDGQLGNGTTAQSTVPVEVSGLNDATQVAAGGALGTAERGHACARRADATAVCWGRNGNGQLGNGDDDDPINEDSNVPVVVKDLTDVVLVATGGFHSCAIVGSGSVKCWGYNGFGQLGNNDDDDPDNEDSNVAVDVSGITNATGLALGLNHSCALLSNGKVNCWGHNGYGQLGDNSHDSDNEPVEVSGIPGIYGLLPVPGATQITAGDNHTCARHSDGLVTCWGQNTFGQLGNGSTSEALVPTPLSAYPPPDTDDILIQAVSAGRWNTCVLLTEMTVACAGDNTSGQLGDGVGPFSLLPLTVLNLGGPLGTNTLPTAVADSIPVPPTLPFSPAPTSLNLLTNDSDPGAPPQVLSVTTVTNGTKGTTSLTPPGTVLYTPNADFCSQQANYGKDTFEYVLTDGVGFVPGIVNVTFACPNRLPVAADDSSTVAEDGTVLIDVLANDTDADAQPLSIGAGSISVPSKGTASIESNQIRYVPNPNQCGSDSFTYAAYDGVGTEGATVSMTIVCAPDAPIADDENVSTTEDVAINIDVLSGDTDPDAGTNLATPLVVSSVNQPPHGGAQLLPSGQVRYIPDAGYCDELSGDSFEYTVTDGSLVDTAVVTVTVNCVASGVNAVDDTASVLEDDDVLIDVLANDSDPDGGALSIVAALITTPAHGTAVLEGGKIRYTPNADYCGADTFGYTAKDSAGETDTATVLPVTVICTQDPPDAIDDNVGGVEDQPVVIGALANDIDVDNDLLSISSIGIPTAPATGTAAIGPNGTITYVPNANSCGADSFSYTVRDPAGATNTATVTVTVACVDDAPTLQAVSNQSTVWGSLLSVPLVANDVDSALVYTLETAPSGAAVNPAGLITWTPTSAQIGVHTITARVTGGTLWTERTFSVTVTKRSVVLTPAVGNGQFSDLANVSAVATDLLSGAPISGLNLGFALGSQSITATTNGGGLASGAIGVVVTSSAPLNVSFAGSAHYLPASGSATFVVNPELVSTSFLGVSLTSTSGTTASVTLSARVTEEADGRYGGSLSTVSVQFRTIAGTPLCTGIVSPTGAGTGVATCVASAQAVGARAVIVVPSSVAYQGGVAVGSFAVSTSTVGNAAGGGMAGGDTFAFQVKPAARKAALTGQAVHVWLDGSGHAFVASGSVTSYTKTCSGGGSSKRCTVAVGVSAASIQRVTLVGGAVDNLGAGVISISATDMPSGTADTYSVAVTGAASRSIGTPGAQVTVSTGSVIAY